MREWIVSNQQWSTFVTRVVLGIVMLAHGVGKFTALDGTTAYFEGLGLPAFLVYVIAIIETLGGLFLILGLFTRYSAALIGLDLLGAIFTARLSSGFIGGYEFELALLALAVSLVFTGSNAFALSNCCKKSKETAATSQTSA